MVVPCLHSARKLLTHPWKPFRLKGWFVHRLILFETEPRHLARPCGCCTLGTQAPEAIGAGCADIE